MAFVLDSSGSITNDKWIELLQFIQKLVEEMSHNSDNLRFSCVVFSTNANVEFDLGTYSGTQDVINHIDKIRFRGGWTNTAEALRVLQDDIFSSRNGDRTDVQDLAIILTDGKATRNVEYTIPYANEAKRKGITILTIGIGPEVDINELEGIATRPDYVELSPDYHKLNAYTKYLVGSACKPPPAGNIKIDLN